MHISFRMPTITFLSDIMMDFFLHIQNMLTAFIGCDRFWMYLGIAGFPNEKYFSNIFYVTHAQSLALF